MNELWDPRQCLAANGTLKKQDVQKDMEGFTEYIQEKVTIGGDGLFTYVGIFNGIIKEYKNIQVGSATDFLVKFARSFDIFQAWRSWCITIFSTGEQWNYILQEPEINYLMQKVQVEDMQAQNCNLSVELSL